MLFRLMRKGNSNFKKIQIEEAIAAQQEDSTKSRAVASDAKTKNVVVVLDPGHDATHAGAIGVNGLREEVLTLK